MQIRGRKRKNRDKEAESSGNVTAPLPGMIVENKKGIGENVKAGETVMVMEAMKMMNNLVSTKNGVVKEIKFKPGDSVSKNDVLMIIEPEE